MSKGDPKDEQETPTGFLRRKPWYQRTEVIASFVVVMGPLVVSALGYLLSHFLIVWNMPNRETRLEHRVMLIEHALKIIDPEPFTGDVTNTAVLAQLGITNKLVIIDP